GVSVVALPERQQSPQLLLGHNLRLVNQYHNIDIINGGHPPSNPLGISEILSKMDELVTSFELELEPDTELAEADTQPFDVALIRKSKIITTISRMRYGSFQGKSACLLAFESKFMPYYGVRFKY